MPTLRSFGLITALTLLQVTGAVEPSANGVRLEITEMASPALPAGIPVIRWVAADDASWQRGDPTFTILNGTAEKARGWVAVRDRAILLKVVVADEQHVNVQEKSDIWDGDGLQIGIDARGDGCGNRSPETRMVGPDDAAITVALTTRGPDIWAYYQGTYGAELLKNGARRYPCKVVRDDVARLTTYEVAVPWEELATLPGQAPCLGLSVQVHDSAPGRQQQRFSWGRGADGMPRPGLFVRLALGAPPAGLLALVPMITRLWTPAGSGEIAVTVARQAELEITAIAGGSEQRFRLAPTPAQDGIRRCIIRATPSVSGAELPLTARISDRSGAVLVERTVPLTFPGAPEQALHQRIAALLAAAPHPLFARHLGSLDALVHAGHIRGILQLAENPGDDGDLMALMTDCQVILDGLRGAGGDWGTYQRGEQALVFTRVAAPDFSLQTYLLTLPRNWDPAATYPLIVDLHGRGPAGPLAYPVQSLANRDGSVTTDDPQAYFRLTPWGRGNAYYDDWSERDVFEALDEVTRCFRTDQDRTYLTGHSMGGSGTWKLALRRPDLWAAVCPVSGGTWTTVLGVGLGANLAQVPVRIWHGAADTVIAPLYAYDMQAELRAGGREPELVIVPGQGHDYPRSARDETTRWLLTHTRKRPDHFAFTADTDRWRGVWGIRMDRDLALSALPRFDCAIQGSEVRITSVGTRGLSVQLADGGLGLHGEVTVWWNGRRSYTGPAKEIRLGDDNR